MKGVACLACGLFGFVLLAVSASAAPGDLDTSFSGNGWVRTYDVRGASAPNPPRRGALDVAVQPDGRVLTVGQLENGQSGEAFGVFRWLPNGDIDRSFGSGGQVIARTGHFASAYAVGVQRDGRILLGGEGDCRFLVCGMVVRLNAAGGLDPSFGRGGIALMSRLVCPKVVRDLALQRDGRIVVVGSRAGTRWFDDDGRFAIARILPDGRLDRTFSRDGCATVNFSSDDDRAHAVVIQRDGRIVTAGEGSLAGGPGRTANFMFVRLRPNGTLDPTFSRDGISFVDFGRIEEAYGLALQPDGRLVAVGLTGPGPSHGRTTVAVAQLRRNGTLDPRFGSRGRVLLRSRFGGYGADVRVQRGGRILVAGTLLEGDDSEGASWLLAGLRPNGRLDRSFSRDGIVLGDFGSGNDWADALVLQPDEKIVVAGSVYEDQALARYLAR